MDESLKWHYGFLFLSPHSAPITLLSCDPPLSVQEQTSHEERKVDDKRFKAEEESSRRLLSIKHRP